MTRAAALPLTAIPLYGCEGVQSALAPAGPVAREIAWLWWGMLGAAAAIFALVLVSLLYAVFRRADERRPLRPRRLVYAGGVILPVVALSVLMPIGVQVGSGAGAPRLDDTVTVRVRGYQWWWDVEYDFGSPHTRFTTANEIYVPTGEPVELLLTSVDVIHSLWVPKLAGKLDLIPGRTNRLMIEADRPGVFRGQCAEYCGMAHTQMSLHVVALPPEEFEDWAERQLQPAPPPEEPAAREGAALFSASGCLVCHTVRGHRAWGREGPDLTHFGSRLTIGAGTLVNTEENVALWIAHNDAVKPGNRMPEFHDLPALIRTRIAAYLETLE